jgi:ubiquinone biosynthesis monooxygenase Coq6
MDEADFIEKINQSLRGPASAPMLGALPDKVLPDLVKRSGFEHPPLINELHTKRFAFPLTLSHADSLASHRMALIGDAAHRVHPLAG